MNTVILVKTQFDKVIGGYTPLIWNKELNSYSQDSEPQSFLFSLTTGDKFTNNDLQNTIYNHANVIRFGKGPDLNIVNYSDKNNCSANIGSSYINSSYAYNDSEKWLKFSGSSANYYFTTK